jgi:hypothetical protein
MEKRTMQWALGATAKVTGSRGLVPTGLSASLALATLALFGCADGEGPSAPLAEASASNGPEATDRTDGSNATTPPAVAETCTDTPCCDALVNAALEGQPDYPGTAEEIASERAALGEAGLSCCARLAYHAADTEAVVERHFTCCLLIEGTALEDASNHAMACTPWGPPMPPLFEEAVG